MFNLFSVAGSVTVGVFFVNDNSTNNVFRDGWDCFLLAIIVSIILIDRIFVILIVRKNSNRIQNRHVTMSEQPSQNK